MPIILSTFCGACEVIRNDIHDIVRVNPMDHEEMDEAIEVLTTGFNNQPDVAKPWVTYTICEMVQDTLQLMTFAG
jgi:hypothetical protein